MSDYLDHNDSPSDQQQPPNKPNVDDAHSDTVTKRLLELKRQHEAACELLKTMKCIEMVDHGEIPLDWKRQPTEEDPYYGFVKASLSENLSDSSQRKRVCISSRGMVDVTKLKELITPEAHTPPNEEVKKIVASLLKYDGNTKIGCAGFTSSLQTHPSKLLQKMKIENRNNYWDPIHASQENVYFLRAAHDFIGIKKVVLIVTDDFLQRIYTLPWYNDTFREHLLPIIHQVVDDERRVVRLLLASLPPNTAIPIHHDTGAWVQHTHRVHVPILVPDPNLVIFRCGPSVETMQRVPCEEGHVFELNNQAKHAVSNCHPTKYRVHLILDYVDPSYSPLPPPIELKKGETLLQIPRAIDPLSLAGSRPTPTYLIIGAQKCGTTSLYDYINQHPLVVRARRRETHCLDWRWNEADGNVQKQREHCYKFYYHSELQYHPSLLTGDSTPSYLLDYVRVLPRLEKAFPHLDTFFVMFRDPVQRSYSHFNMVTAQDGTPEQIKIRGTEWLNTSFDDVVVKDIQQLKEDGVIPYLDMETQTVDQAMFDSFINTPEEDAAYRKYSTRIPLNTESHSLVSRGLYALQLRPWFQAYDPCRFLILELKQLYHEDLPSTMEAVFEHLKLPLHSITDSKPKNARSYTEPMSPATKGLLQRFYQPHNERLQQLLQEHPQASNLWKSENPWPYEIDE